MCVLGSRTLNEYDDDDIFIRCRNLQKFEKLSVNLYNIDRKKKKETNVLIGELVRLLAARIIITIIIIIIIIMHSTGGKCE